MASVWHQMLTMEQTLASVWYRLLTMEATPRKKVYIYICRYIYIYIYDLRPWAQTCGVQRAPLSSNPAGRCLGQLIVRQTRNAATWSSH